VTPYEFCKHFGACMSGRDYASDYKTLKQAWNNCPWTAWLGWALSQVEHDYHNFFCWALDTMIQYAKDKGLSTLHIELDIIKSRYISGTEIEAEVFAHPISRDIVHYLDLDRRQYLVWGIGVRLAEQFGMSNEDVCDAIRNLVPYPLTAIRKLNKEYRRAA